MCPHWRSEGDGLSTTATGVSETSRIDGFKADGQLVRGSIRMTISPTSRLRRVDGSLAELTEVNRHRGGRGDPCRIKAELDRLFLWTAGQQHVECQEASRASGVRPADGGSVKVVAGGQRLLVFSIGSLVNDPVVGFMAVGVSWLRSAFVGLALHWSEAITVGSVVRLAGLVALKCVGPRGIKDALGAIQVIFLVSRKRTNERPDKEDRAPPGPGRWLSQTCPGIPKSSIGHRREEQHGSTCWPALSEPPRGLGPRIPNIAGPIP
jgi:hypothetical protein